MGASGIRGCGTKYGDQIVVAMMERCLFGEEVDTIERSLALPHFALFSHVAGDAVPRHPQLRIQCGAEPLALIVVGEAVEQRVFYFVETLDRLWRTVDRIAALLAIVGVGHDEERILLGRDEAV